MLRIFKPVFHDRAEVNLLKGEHTLKKSELVSYQCLQIKKKETRLGC